MPLKVVFDTDIGSDIDDAVALAYLLARSDCELVGITTVTGDVQKRAALCEILCRAGGQPDIPIHCGRRLPFASGPGQPNVPQYEPVASYPHRLDRPENTAPAFIASHAHPDHILLSVGPLGNLAAAEALDPGCLRRYGSVVSMLGRYFDEGHWEWNGLVDPASTAIVLHQEIRDHLLVGLDVTLQVQLPAPEVRSRFQGPVLSVVAQMAEAWFSHSEHLTFHDPLAAALLFEPTLCQTERGRSWGGWPDGEGKGGQTFWQPDPEGPHLACREVDPSAFFTEYFSVFPEAAP